MSDISQFLTNEELQTITGYKLPYKQIEWLQSNGWSFIVNAANHPIVHRSIMLIKLGVPINTVVNKDNLTSRKWKPDYSKVN